MDDRDELVRRFDEALALNRRGEHREAVRLLRQLQRVGFQPPAVVAALGRVLLHDLASPPEALPYLRASVRLSPRSEAAHVALASAWLAAGQPARALAERRRFARLTGADPAGPPDGDPRIKALFLLAELAYGERLPPALRAPVVAGCWRERGDPTVEELLRYVHRTSEQVEAVYRSRLSPDVRSMLPRSIWGADGSDGIKARGEVSAKLRNIFRTMFDANETNARGRVLAALKAALGQLAPSAASA